ncbi:hypothetical protein BS50DRAFT_530540 [Corynespora cassiicola Philippines]|uniref:Uncharacterized protein n=1 Tax=Corynespora cassiicola Philippines TaxID=1448308 RepID=A0A2T2NC27_CORCC|nr:hypothetical protein BS50DRAFT_530540 [Corynespora cassiicola Philippines]
MAAQVIEPSFVPDPDLGRFIRPYQLLVVIPTDVGSSIILGYWQPLSLNRTSSHYLQVFTHLKLSQIELLQNYEDFGVLSIPSSRSNIATFFRRQIADMNASSADPDMASKLLHRLRSLEHPETNDVLEIRILAIKIFGEEGVGLLTRDQRLTWKWSKPQSPYQKSGFWETELEKAVTDAEWSAGKGFSILGRGVSEEEYEKIRRGKIKC